MLRRRAFAEIHFRYALDLRRAASVQRGARGAIMGGVSFAFL